MKRLAVLAVATILFGNNGMPKTYWGVTNAKAETTAYAVVRSAGGPIETPKQRARRERRFAQRLLATWNAVAGNHGFPADKAVCPADGEAVYSCTWRYYDTSLNRYRCYFAVLSQASDGGYTQFKHGPAKCTGKLRPATPA